jgi:hypothetical protein
VNSTNKGQHVPDASTVKALLDELGALASVAKSVAERQDPENTAPYTAQAARIVRALERELGMGATS